MRIINLVMAGMLAIGVATKAQAAHIKETGVATVKIQNRTVINSPYELRGRLQVLLGGQSELRQPLSSIRISGGARRGPPNVDHAF